MLIFDYQVLRVAAQADALDALMARLCRLADHGVLASTWYARQFAVNHPEDAAHGRILGCMSLTWLSELAEPRDLDCLLLWCQRLVPRDGPEAGAHADVACALAYAQSRQAIAVLADRDHVGIAATTDPGTRAVWLPALLHHLADPADGPAGSETFIRRLVEDGGARWKGEELEDLSRFAF